MKYYEIIPLTKISLSNRPSFTYCSNMKDLENNLVEIPFGRKKIKGIAIRKVKKPAFLTKKILLVLERKSITEKQLLLAKKISAYYLTNLGTVLKFFVFKKTKKVPPLKKTRIVKETFPLLTNKQLSACKKILKSKEREFLLFGPASSGKTEIIMQLVKNTIKNKRQSLIIIPEILLSYHEILRYRKRFASEKVALLHSDVKPSEFSSIHKNCKNGKLKLLISTKIGLFLPFKDLGFIAVDEEQDTSHKQWAMSPRYHSRKTASFLSEIWRAKLIYVSATPSLEMINKFSKSFKRSGFIKLPMLKKNKLWIKKPKIEILNAKKHHLKEKAGQIFLKETLATIEKTLKNKKLSFILLPRRGKSRITICNSCKKILLCPKCQTPLIQIENNYKCIHCNFKKSLFSRCSHCKSFSLKNVGTGTEKAVENLKTLFPEARIRQADQTIFSKNSKREKLFSDIHQNKVDILVGTQSIIKGFDFPNLELAVVVNAENWSGKTDYRYDERWLGSLFQLAGRTNRLGSSQNGKIIIQTYQEENPLFDFLINWKWLDFAKKEMADRKTLKYPPYWNLIKLTCKNSNLEKVEKYAKDIYGKALKKKIIVSNPYWGFNRQIRNSFQKNILIKLKGNRTKNLKDLTGKLNNHWKIDVDPENIF